MIETSSSNTEFYRFAGELAESLSFNKSVGQIYGLLFMQTEPMSLETIAKTLGMSKGNASINVRFLESWGAVRSVSLSGTRKDHYLANHNIKEIAFRRLQEGVGRRLDLAQEALDRLAPELERQNDPQAEHRRKKIQELRSLVSTGRKAIKMLPKLAGFLLK